MGTRKIYIAGGGPAGLAAAIEAYDTIKNNNNDKSSNHDYVTSKASHTQKQKETPQIIILEKKDKIGQTILSTGNGRCNFSNIKLAKKSQNRIYKNHKFFNKVNQALNKNCKNKVYKFFDNIGLAWQIKQDGMMFPYTNKASTVLDVLRFAIEERNIKIITNWTPNTDNIKFSEEDKVIIATGASNKNNFRKISQNFIKSNYSDRVCVNTEERILGPLTTNTKIVNKLDGTRAYVGLSVIKQNASNKQTLFYEEGELLFRKYGVSGIVVFNASRFVVANKNVKLLIDFFPEIDIKQLTELLAKRLNNFLKLSKKINLQRLMAGLLLPNIVQVVAKTKHIQTENISQKEIPKIAKAFKKFELRDPKIHDSKLCQVSRGGFSTNEIDPNTMSLKNQPNIYLAGECVDIDGPCGGYNLHWAWTSGLLAGRSAAYSLIKQNI